MLEQLVLLGLGFAPQGRVHHMLQGSLYLILGSVKLQFLALDARDGFFVAAVNWQSFALIAKAIP